MKAAPARDLAREAIPARSDGLTKTSARCLSVALAYSPSVAVARKSIEELAQADIRAAALNEVAE